MQQGEKEEDAGWGACQLQLLLQGKRGKITDRWRHLMQAGKELSLLVSTTCRESTSSIQYEKIVATTLLQHNNEHASNITEPSTFELCFLRV